MWCYAVLSVLDFMGVVGRLEREMWVLNGASWVRLDGFGDVRIRDRGSMKSAMKPLRWIENISSLWCFYRRRRPSSLPTFEGVGLFTFVFRVA